MEDVERDTLAFDRVRDDDPDARVLPGAEGWGSAGDDDATRRTVTLEGRASRVGWYVAGGGLLGALGLTLIVIALSSSQPATSSVQSHQRVVILPAQRSPRRPHHHPRPDRKPTRRRRPRVVPRHRVIHRQAVVPVAPPSPPAPVMVVAEPRSPAPVVVPVPAEEPRAPQHRSSVGQFGYLGR
jgi:hypothetical protein